MPIDEKQRGAIMSNELSNNLVLTIGGLDNAYQYGEADIKKSEDFNSKYFDYAKDKLKETDTGKDLIAKLKDIEFAGSTLPTGFFAGLFDSLFGNAYRKANKFYAINKDLKTHQTKVNELVKEQKNKLIDNNKILATFLTDGLESYRNNLQNATILEQEIKAFDENILPGIISKKEQGVTFEESEELNDYLSIREALEVKLETIKTKNTVITTNVAAIRKLRDTNKKDAYRVEEVGKHALDLWKLNALTANAAMDTKTTSDIINTLIDFTEKAFLDTTNSVKVAVVEGTKSANRPIVSMPILKQGKTNIVSAYDESNDISNKGAVRRIKEQGDYPTIENELVGKMLEVNVPQENIRNKVTEIKEGNNETGTKKPTALMEGILNSQAH